MVEPITLSVSVIIAVSDVVYTRLSGSAFVKSYGEYRDQIKKEILEKYEPKFKEIIADRSDFTKVADKMRELAGDLEKDALPFSSFDSINDAANWSIILMIASGATNLLSPQFPEFTFAGFSLATISFWTLFGGFLSFGAMMYRSFNLTKKMTQKKLK